MTVFNDIMLLKMRLFRPNFPNKLSMYERTKKGLMMTNATVEFKVEVRWWFKYVVGFCIILKVEPPQWVTKHGLKLVRIHA